MLSTRVEILGQGEVPFNVQIGPAANPFGGPLLRSEHDHEENAEAEDDGQSGENE
jgi:hypothetical protein